MTSELEGYLDQLLSIRQDYPGIVADLSHAQFNWRPAPDRWSIAQCFEHLNLTPARFLPAIDAAIDDARRRGLLAPGPFSYPLVERWFVRWQEPPPTLRARAFKSLVPPADRSPSDVLEAFAAWQEHIADRI